MDNAAIIVFSSFFRHFIKPEYGREETENVGSAGHCRNPEQLARAFTAYGPERIVRRFFRTLSTDFVEKGVSLE
jgi:hypothetical protein